ncbi:hypothetical protein [Effusibacillus lacus]|uniref:hypothetical protein n=1 Tax=Effusibacillus lacus TaxID=1348429 RepID=UPI000BB8A130|nr:hypothetical protein [Effusibacillus lacus]TCS74335.1 hypothetical protein EDD64_11475 [Effusibacillus lacus]
MGRIVEFSNGEVYKQFPNKQWGLHTVRYTDSPRTSYSRPSGQRVEIAGEVYRVDRNTGSVDVNELNKAVERRKIEYMNAQARGDYTAMERAHREANELRKAGATLGANEDTATTKVMKKSYEGIKVEISRRSVEDLNKRNGWHHFC